MFIECKMNSISRGIDMKKDADNLSIKGLEVPFYHFVYEGDFYKYLRIRNNKNFGNGMRINEYFLTETFKQYDFHGEFTAFAKAMMVIIHHFTDYTERDLDNNSYKPVIDAVRKTGIIENDSWFNLSLMLLGDDAENENIEVFIMPHEYTTDFLFSNELSSLSDLFKRPSISSITTNKEMSESKHFF
jgi:hypothetical protein